MQIADGRRQAVWLAILLLLVCLAGPAQDRPPNIVVITADNLGYSDIGCYGNPTNKTPHLDRLATEGVRLTSFYTAGATCTVSRAALLTGRYPQRIGLNHQLSVEENRSGVGLPHRERLIPQYLKPLGYATGCFGKWNIGFAPGSRPTERGFNEFLGHRSGNMDYYTHVYAGEHDLYRGTEPAYVDGYATDLFAGAAVDFMRRHRDQPFFLYVPLNAVHYPAARNKAPGRPNVWQAPPEFFRLYGYSPEEDDPKKRYQATVTALDAGVGQVLAAIDELQLTGDTLVVFYSDNGAFMMPDKGLEVATNRPLRSGGNTLWEGGIRVVGLVRWPGRIEPGTVVDQPIISLDLLPMFLRAAGTGLPANVVLDGRDPMATLSAGADSPHDALYWKYLDYSAVRSGRYKLIREADNQAFQLYDVENDIGETRDLAASKPDVVRELEERFAQWLASVSE